MFKKFLIMFCVYIQGIRFYTTERTPPIKQFRKSVFETIDGKKVEFFFYKEIYTDYIRKYNRVKETQHVAYSIRMEMNDDMGSVLKEYNNLKIVFKYDFGLVKCENELDTLLLYQYMHFLENLIKIKKYNM
jgi:hypothetical protein